jgi:transcriptional regulator with XRE-family HTH domain
MLSANKLKELCQQQQMNVEQLADQLARPGFDKKKSIVAVKNWQKGLFKPRPRADDIRHLAAALSGK